MDKRMLLPLSVAKNVVAIAPSFYLLYPLKQCAHRGFQNGESRVLAIDS